MQAIRLNDVISLFQIKQESWLKITNHESQVMTFWFPSDHRWPLVQCPGCPRSRVPPGSPAGATLVMAAMLLVMDCDVPGRAADCCVVGRDCPAPPIEAEDPPCVPVPGRAADCCVAGRLPPRREAWHRCWGEAEVRLEVGSFLLKLNYLSWLHSDFLSFAIYS